MSIFQPKIRISVHDFGREFKIDVCLNFGEFTQCDSELEKKKSQGSHSPIQGENSSVKEDVLPSRG